MDEGKTLGRMPAPIRKITVTDAAFQGEVIEPACINFFYGKNGAGKSTIAEAVRRDSGVEWEPGKSAAGFDVLVYNQGFIRRNFENYGNVDGVFTVCETNIEIAKQVEAKTKKREELEAAAAGYQIALDQKIKAKESLLDILQDACWDKTKALKDTFKDACFGMGRKKALLDMLLAVKTPKEHDLEELKRMYDVAFRADSRPYPLFSRVEAASAYGTLPGRELLDKVVISSSGTPFAKFMNALGASDWVRRGHTHYTAGAEGRCPFCQQALPKDFEKDIASCFDEQYRQDISDIMAFQSAYTSETAAILEKLRNNLADTMPGLELAAYKDKLALLEGSISVNIRRIADKLKEPAGVAALEDTDSLLLEIGALIDGINRKIQANNDVANDKRNKKKECGNAVKEHFAFLAADDAAQYSASLAKAEKEIAALTDTIKKMKGEIRALAMEIADLNRQAVNTQAAIDSMNAILKDSGFQGFYLHAKAGAAHVYEVVRKGSDGKARVVESLSEGERNFIAFLYFCHLVKGSRSSGEVKDKIVVIDDPVSGMDGSALHIVGALVREMIDVCYNNTCYKGNSKLGGCIKQIFIFTHNVYFYSEVTYQQEKNYQSTSFYKILKTDNVPAVELCTRKNPNKPDGVENYNPVQNSYKALWTELKETKTAIPALSVIRRILECYFIQICGYDRKQLRSHVLEGSCKSLFVTPAAEGEKPDYTKYHRADAMLAYISTPAGFGSGLYYVEESEAAQPYKDVLELIFTAMGQHRHYKMMMELD